MPRSGQKSYIQQMKEDTLKQRGGDPNKRGNPENPYRYQLPKQAKGKVDKEAFNSNFKNQT